MSYQKRDSSEKYSQRTSIFENESLFFQNHFLEMELFTFLRKSSIRSLGNCRILDIGGGIGDKAKLFFKWNNPIHRYHSVDLAKHRTHIGKRTIPDCNFITCNGAFLPYKKNTFDIVLIAMCFDSVFDEKVRVGIARESIRVLKDNGVILFYDYRKVLFLGIVNELRARFLARRDPDRIVSRPISRKEIKNAFAGMDVEISIRTAGLHPWIADGLVKCGIAFSFLYVIAALMPPLRFYNVVSIQKSHRNGM